MPEREVVCADSLHWMPQQRPKPGWGVVTSLPDAQEIGITDWEMYEAWFVEAAGMVCKLVHPGQPVLFFQTDRKSNGHWRSKATLCHQAAADAGLRCLWHKVVLRRQAGAVDLHRPGYSHLLAYSKEGKPGPATPDVLLPSGSLYKNGMPVAAALRAAAHLSRTCATLVDPFCGFGTTLAAAWAYDMDCLGVDLDPMMVERAKHVPALQRPL